MYAQDSEAAAGKHAKHVEHEHGRKDEHAWISLGPGPPLPRYDYAAGGANPELVATWEKMDLKHVLGFPLWEKEVHELLLRPAGLNGILAVIAISPTESRID